MLQMCACANSWLLRTLVDCEWPWGTEIDVRADLQNAAGRGLGTIKAHNSLHNQSMCQNSLPAAD